jgi:hypothetical protein
MPDEARIWVHRTEQQLLRSLDRETQFEPRFVDPGDPFWAVYAAQSVLEDWSQLVENQGSDKSFDAAMDQFLRRMAYWLRRSMDVDPALDVQELVLRRLVAVQVATQLFLKVRESRWSQNDGALLQVAFASGHSTAIRMGVDLLLQAPPDSWSSSALSLSPLLQYDDWDIDIVFPRILESTNPSILASALDIANHLTSKGRVDAHPCRERYNELVQLLGSIVQRLGVLEEDPKRFGETAKEVQRILFDSVSLCVSLCHTLSQLGNDSCIGKLRQAADLKHRRIRTEAAYALAKLGSEQGFEMLVELASDPSTRSRALAYAEELDCLERIDERNKTILAHAEAQLAQWLAQIEQMGLPPTRMELLEQRTLPWPGYDGPQECFLFRFGYGLQDSEFSNVGIAGPTVKAFSQDLANVPIDDAFAMFAGWDIEHPEVYEQPAHQLATSVQELVQSWIDGPLSHEFETVELSFIGHFFGQDVLVAFGTKDLRKQPFAFDGDQLIVCPSLKPNQETLSLVYYLWRGRAFFRAFE